MAFMCPAHRSDVSITATANIPIVVDLQNVSCTLSHPSSAEVTINARTIGDVTCRQNGITNFHHYYVDPPSAAPGTPSFQIKRGVATQVNVDLESDPGFGPFQNVWEDVGVGAFWGFVYSGTGTGTAWDPRYSKLVLVSNPHLNKWKCSG
jgi:hypothetical protein